MNNKKIIKPGLILDYVTPVSLAYWFMDDGSKLDHSKNKGKGIVFNTQGFSELSVDMMIKELEIKYNFIVWKSFNKNKPIIKLSGHSYNSFYELVFPYMHPSMYYKLPRLL